MIRYANILGESVVDGLGIRVVVFLQGCPRHCPGCHNPALLPVDGGTEIAEDQLANLILSKVTPLHRGITFSGGDPLLQDESLSTVISIIRCKKPNLDIWVYTGYVYEEIQHMSLLKFIDILIDGPFIAAEKDLKLAWRGSANQRIIQVPASLQAGKAVELEIRSGASSFSRAV